MRTLEQYLSSDFSDERIKKTKRNSSIDIESENFQFDDSNSTKNLLEKIKTFFILKGYNIEKTPIPGVFDIKDKEELIALFVFTQKRNKNSAFITVTPWGKFLKK